MKKLSPKLTLAIAVILGVGLIQPREVRADSPPPPPVISIYQMNAYGYDLAVTLSADPTTGALPDTAYVEVFDPYGNPVSLVPFTLIPGEQTVWVPGALAPRSTDPVDLPIEREIDVFGGPYEEVFASIGATVGTGGSVLSRPRRPLPKKYCYLHLIRIKCYETETSGGADDAYLKVNGKEIWRRWIDNNQEDDIDEWFLMEESQGDFKVELWDDDWPDGDDHLGTLTVKREATVVSRHFDFTLDGANYRIFYEVRCFRRPLPGI